ncbi:MAG: PVC-type heme-binding CxxCH protein, partial [Planctomycetota bacterium]
MTLALRIVLLPIVLTGLAIHHLSADEFPELFNTEAASETNWLSADQAAKQMQLPDGFRASVFASEPDVQNPIDMAWDSRGRLWIAENYTYAERSQQFQLDLRDRVTILEDTNRDGKADSRKVFTDQVQMLTSVELGHGGVWLMCPPRLLFLPDANRDDVPDGPAQVVLDGFEVAKANYHNFANGLRFGPDGWLYGRCGGSCPGRIGAPGTPDDQRVALEGGIWRYHPRHKSVEVLTAGTTNPWGHDWNDQGEMFFVNTVNGHLWHMIPGAHYTRPFTLDPNPHIYELIDFHADHWHFDTGKSWTASRDGAANDLGGGHAHSGTMIYHDSAWPKRYQGKLFTLNFHGRRANVESIPQHGSGYLATHKPDFVVAADPWFRGMELSCGPSGDAYVLDWSDAGECHEHDGVHRTSGRVFRIAYRDATNAEWQTRVGSDDLTSLSDLALAKLHRDPSRWVRDVARRILAGRVTAGQTVADAAGWLREEFANARNATARVQALLSLHAIDSASVPFLLRQLSDQDESVRVLAIRLLTDTWRIDDAYGPSRASAVEAAKNTDSTFSHVDRLVSLAATDSSPRVALALASTLQRLPLERRAMLATPLVKRQKWRGDHNLPLMLWYGIHGLADSDPQQLAEIGKRCSMPTTLRLITRRLTESIEDQPQPLDVLLAHFPTSDRSWQVAVLNGMAAGLKGIRKATPPARWSEVMDASKSTTLEATVRDLS